MSSTLETPKKISFEDFLDWALKQEERVEWVDGETVYLSPVSGQHQELGAFLITLLNIYVKYKGLGRIFYEQFLIRLAGIPRGREPDVFFVATEHLDRVRDNYLDGAADLAIEIISPDSIERDYRDKLREYERAGIREYWIIDPLINVVIFHQLGANGNYAVIEPDDNGRYESSTIDGLWVNVNWLRVRPVPDELTVLKLWGIV